MEPLTHGSVKGEQKRLTLGALPTVFNCGSLLPVHSWYAGIQETGS